MDHFFVLFGCFFQCAYVIKSKKRSSLFPSQGVVEGIGGVFFLAVWQGIVLCVFLALVEFGKRGDSDDVTVG